MGVTKEWISDRSIHGVSESVTRERVCDRCNKRVTGVGYRK